LDVKRVRVSMRVFHVPRRNKVFARPPPQPKALIFLRKYARLYGQIEIDGIEASGGFTVDFDAIVENRIVVYS
jgi:hypothetical protein